MLSSCGLLFLVFATSLSVAPLLTAAPKRLATTPEEWMRRALKLYERKFGNTSLVRHASYSPDDWPGNAGNLVRLNQFDVPLLGQPSFIEPNLQITGIGRKGEVFQLLETRELLFLSNPLSNDWKAPNGNGIWARIRGIDGVEGWIFAGTRSTPVTYISAVEGNKDRNTTPLSYLIINALFNLTVLAGIIALLYRWLTRSRQTVQTAPISSPSISYDNPCYSGGSRRIADEEDDGQLDAEETDDEETDRSGGSSRRKGVIDLIEDMYEQTIHIPERRKCPDCDGDATFDPQETGDGVCSECHGSGCNLDPLENEECPACGGKRRCQTCRGKGYIND